MQPRFLSLVLFAVLFVGSQAAQLAPAARHNEVSAARDYSRRATFKAAVKKTTAVKKPAAKKKPVAKKTAVKKPAVKAKPVAKKPTKTKKVAPKATAKKTAAKPKKTKKVAAAKTTPKAVATKAAKAKTTAVKTAAKAKATKAAKAKGTTKAASCPVKSKSSVKGRTTETTKDCDESANEVAAEVCASFEGCVQCVQTGGKQSPPCAFDGATQKCVVKSSGSSLITTTAGCTAATTSASEPSDAQKLITQAATKAFSSSVQSHIFVGSSTDKGSGRHILSVWTKDNKGRTTETKRNTKTGVVEFSLTGSNKIKTVWNDVQSSDGTVVYTQAQIKAMCLRGYELSIEQNSANKAALKSLENPPPAASGKKKGKAVAPATASSLKIIGGTSTAKNRLLVQNPVINKLVCLNIDEASCYPVGLGTSSGKEGEQCTADSGSITDNE
uniref:Uncharacterized protein n=1 Tax=Mycena chlorophos TaxID=658473 RepID=A0ABQ0LMW0_MYCCL|nr:predicted protein [Mycena chlorophos]